MTAIGDDSGKANKYFETTIYFRTLQTLARPKKADGVLSFDAGVCGPGQGESHSSGLEGRADDLC